MNPKKKKKEKAYQEEEYARFKPGVETNFPHIATMLLHMGDDKAAQCHARKLRPHLQDRVLALPSRRKEITA